MQDRNKRDLEAQGEDAKTLERAAKILAQKAELYNKLASGQVPTDDVEGDKYLVDFERKAMAQVRGVSTGCNADCRCSTSPTGQRTTPSTFIRRRAATKRLETSACAHGSC